MIPWNWVATEQLCEIQRNLVDQRQEITGMQHRRQVPGSSERQKPPPQRRKQEYTISLFNIAMENHIV